MDMFDLHIHIVEIPTWFLAYTNGQTYPQLDPKKQDFSCDS